MQSPVNLFVCFHVGVLREQTAHTHTRQSLEALRAAVAREEAQGGNAHPDGSALGSRQLVGHRLSIRSNWLQEQEEGLEWGTRTGGMLGEGVSSCVEKCR
jgi:hypothetical protein